MVTPKDIVHGLKSQNQLTRLRVKRLNAVHTHPFLFEKRCSFLRFQKHPRPHVAFFKLFVSPQEQAKELENAGFLMGVTCAFFSTQHRNVIVYKIVRFNPSTGVQNGVFKNLYSGQPVDCSQSPIFSWDRRDIARLTVNGGHLDFQMYRGETAPAP